MGVSDGLSLSNDKGQGNSFIETVINIKKIISNKNSQGEKEGNIIYIVYGYNNLEGCSIF